MGLITKEVEMTWVGSNTKYYINKDYKYTKQYDKFIVKIKDLPLKSSYVVDVECDNCFKKLQVIYANFNKCKKGNKYYCVRCANELYAHEKMRNTKLKNTISFEEWCLDNNRQDVLDRFDYKLNKCLSSEITYGTHIKYYFKCPKGIHDSELKDIKSFVRGREGSIQCNKCNSFAQWGIDNLGDDFLELYWDIKNDINPWEISYGSSQKILIKCQNKIYHESNLIACNTFVSGVRCGYCAGIKIHPKDSFAQYHINNTDKDFFNKYWSSKNTLNPWNLALFANKYIWVKCQNKSYHEEYKIRACDFSLGKRCYSCNGSKVHYLDSIGNLYPEILKFWSNKNNKTSFEYLPSSHKIIWLKCLNNKHEDFCKTIHNAIRDEFHCPECTRERKESFLQEKVRIYISDKYNFELNHEYNCSIVPINSRTKLKMPFDNEVIDLKLIIEVNGEAHYKINPYRGKWRDKNKTPEQQLKYQQIKDRYKRIVAHLNGYHYLEIPYWSEKDESYKQLIDDKINSILLQEAIKKIASFILQKE